MQTLLAIFDRWKKEGYRMTSARLNLLHLFTQKKTPISIEEIASFLNKKRKRPDRSTLYREIDFLKNEGILQEFYFDETKRYELTLFEHHHHLVCRNCGLIQDVEVEENWDRLTSKVKKTTGFQIDSHQLDFLGLCQQCVKA